MRFVQHVVTLFVWFFVTSVTCTVSAQPAPATPPSRVDPAQPPTPPPAESTSEAQPAAPPPPAGSVPAGPKPAGPNPAGTAPAGSAPTAAPPAADPPPSANAPAAAVPPGDAVPQSAAVTKPVEVTAGDSPSAAATETDTSSDDPVDAPPFPPGETHVTSPHAVDHDESQFVLGKGLSVSSADGDFALETRLRAQFLYTVSAEEDTPGDLGSATQGFEIRRARLQFTGHFWGPNNRFKTELAVSPADMGVRDSLNSTAPGTSLLLDWYLDLTHSRDASVRIGQYKVPFNRQRVISSGDLQLVDRSIVNSNFNVDRDLGLDLRSKDLFGLGMLRYYLGVYTGEGRNTNHESDFGMMYLARIEVLPLGMFDDYSEASLERPDTPKVSIALGYGHIDRAKHDRGILGSVPADGGTTDVNLLNADVMFKLGGLSIFSEGVLRKGSRQAGNLRDETTNDLIAAAPALDGYGAMIQAGYLFPETRFEVAARAGMVRPIDDSPLSEQNELGGGLSYYFAHHSYKLQADYFMLSEKADSADSLLGHQGRVQLQAAF